jgi:uncharacterized protein
MRRLLFVAMLFLGCGGFGLAQAPAPAAAPAGHWVGSIQAGPGLDVEVDIAKDGAGWRGTISIPQQFAKGVPLADVAVKETTLSFAMKGVPGDPRFSGEVSKDGKTITGTFSQGGGSVPMTLAWKGEAQFEKAVKNPAVSSAMAGTWEGALNVQGTTLRLRLVLTNGADGATGTLVSLDQGNAQIPLSAITEQGTHLKVTAPMISGGFEGDLKGDELTGTWTQGPGTFPLTFKKKP